MDINMVKELISKVYTYTVSEPECTDEKTGVDVDAPSWGMQINNWSWNGGVGVIALAYLADCLKSDEIVEYLIQWVERNKHMAIKFDHVNRMAPFTIFPDLYYKTGNCWYKETAVEYADWILENSSRTEGGIFQHGKSSDNEIWADTIFMVVIFLAKMSALTGEPKYAREAVYQLIGHYKYLTDKKTSLLFHGYNCADKNYKSGALWARGNSWLVSATPMIIEYAKDYTDIPGELLTCFHNLVDAVSERQCENGLWNTVLDHPEFYCESSAGAGIGFGILKGINIGILDKKYAGVYEKAIKGVISNISEAGIVQGVSGGTPIMKTVEEYGELSCYPTIYGQGLTLMLLGEYIK